MRTPSAGRNGNGLKGRLPPLRAHFRQSPTLNNTAYRELFSVDAAVASRELRLLADDGLLLRRGAKRGTHYLATPKLRRR